MWGVGLLETVIVSLLSVPILIVIGVFGLLALKMLRGGRSAEASEQGAEETRLIQDVYHGLQKMEQRVEALETILLAKERKEDE